MSRLPYFGNVFYKPSPRIPSNTFLALFRPVEAREIFRLCGHSSIEIFLKLKNYQSTSPFDCFNHILVFQKPSFLTCTNIFMRIRNTLNIPPINNYEIFDKNFTLASFLGQNISNPFLNFSWADGIFQFSKLLISLQTVFIIEPYTVNIQDFHSQKNSTVPKLCQLSCLKKNFESRKVV